MNKKLFLIIALFIAFISISVVSAGFFDFLNFGNDKAGDVNVVEDGQYVLPGTALTEGDKNPASAFGDAGPVIIILGILAIAGAVYAAYVIKRRKARPLAEKENGDKEA